MILINIIIIGKKLLNISHPQEIWSSYSI